MAAKANQRVVFVVDLRSLDINCARLVKEPNDAEMAIRMKHQSRAVTVPRMLCFDTLWTAKAFLIGHVKMRERSIMELEYDEENFWVA